MMFVHANYAVIHESGRLRHDIRASCAVASIVTPAAQMFYDWAGGLIWLAMPFEDEPGAAAVRDAVAVTGGHATLVRASAAIRAAVDVFHPEEAGVAALGRRVKESFDPQGVLNPGRLWAGV